MKRILTVALISIYITASLAAQNAGQKSGTHAARIPDTPAGRQFAAFLQAFNTGDIKVIREFVATHSAKSALELASVDEYAVFYAMFYKETGGISLYSIKASSDYKIEAVARTKLTDEWVGLLVETVADPPYGLLGIGYTPTPRPPEANPNVKLSQDKIVQQLQLYLDKLVRADLFSGVVLLAKDGQPVFKRAYGIASRTYGVANRVDTKFNIGSLSKMFTAVAIAQLVEQGKLALQEPIIKYLPDYPNKEVASKIAIHHLLSHTSGLADYPGDKFKAAKAGLMHVQDYFPLFVDAPLSFEPGQKFEYSNSGFLVLGAIIEKMSGQEYFNYVSEHIFKPIGMTDTDSYELDEDIPNLATGYTRRDLSGRPVLDTRRNNLFTLPIKGSPAGSAYSTVDDLLKFDLALRQHKLLTAKYTEMFLSGKVDVAPGVKYAYGFFDYQVNGKRIVGHNGVWSGADARLDMYLEQGYTVIVLSNYDTPTAERVAIKLREMLTQ